MFITRTSTERSSMNIFYKKDANHPDVLKPDKKVESTLPPQWHHRRDAIGEDNGDDVVIMSFASKDVHGPKFFVDTPFPASRTFGYYTVNNCFHEFTEGLVQLRSGDEGESLVRVCKKCSFKEIKN